MAVRHQKAPQTSTIRIEAVRCAPQSQENFLHDLFGSGSIVNETSSQAEYGAGVTPVGLSESLIAVPSDSEHECRIRGIAKIAEHDCFTEPLAGQMINRRGPPAG